MKKRTLLTSIMTIALCLSLIVGSTFALFTSRTDVDILIDAGRVNIEAGLTTPVLYSVDPIVDGETATEFDENGKGYIHELQAGNTFANGGTAILSDRQNNDGTTTSNGVITIDNITPGDKMVFTLTGANTSNVAVQYRYKIECLEGYDLVSGFVYTVAEPVYAQDGTVASYVDVEYASMAEYTSAWEPLAVGADIAPVALALELPVSAGNEYQELDAKIKISVEAVQANADTRDDDSIEVKYITIVKDAEELASKIYADEILHIFVDEDVNETVVIDKDLTDKTIDANGNNVALSFGNGNAADPIKLDNVIIKNIVDTADETAAVTITSSVVGDITITDSKLYNGFNSPYGGVAGNGTGPKLDVTVERCEFISGIGAVNANGDPAYGEKYGLYMTNAQNVTVRDSEFSGFGSWAIIVNGTVTGNIVITGCTFTDCAGIFKTSVAGSADPSWQTGSLNGNFTFANNKMYNCTMKDGTYMQMKNLYGTVTFSNNTHNDVVVTVDDMKCAYLTEKYNAQ